jgi:ATP-dependent metalloprotease FtsH
MDGKGGRSPWMHKRWRPFRDTKQTKKVVCQFLGNHKRSLVTAFLLLMIGVTLVGITSLLPSPSFNSVPNGVTPISYSAFIQQVKASNVVAVQLQGNTINGLLAKPYSTRAPVQATPTANPVLGHQAQFTAWSRYVAGGDSLWPATTQQAQVNPALVVYTQLPNGGDAGLTSLLLAYHVTVSTLPPAQQPLWLTVLGRSLPVIILLLIMLVILLPKNRNRGQQAMDNRITQFAKSRIRPVERAKERAPNQAVAKKPQGGVNPLQPPAAATAASPSGAKPRVSLEPPVTFADVAGIDEVRTELEEVVQFLRRPEHFSRLGAHIPRGVLLVGQPGTGKTLLAKAVAGEAGVPFFSSSASEFVEMFVGVGASRVRDLFNKARQSSPCVIFIDELDAVGRKRSMRVGSNDERDQTLNQLLVELDGFDARKAVVVMAATNRVDILDKALLRPGRFDRTIMVSLPDRAGREAILKVHTRRTPLHEDVCLGRLASLTIGMTGADLANLVNEAALCAARRDLDKVTHDCFEEALIRVQLGALRPIVMSEAEKRIIAYHEGGHALVAYHLPEADSVNRVTILPRGQSLGVTQFIAEEDRYNYSRETLMARIAVGLGGRAAEELTLGPEKVTTGAENDFQMVTQLAHRMVTRWGMSQELGVIFADHEQGMMGMNARIVDPASLPTQAHSLSMNDDGCLSFNTRPSRLAMSIASADLAASSPPPMAVVIDAEVRRIISDGYATARAILTEHRDQLVRLADALMEHEQLDRKQFEELMRE